MNHNSSPVFRTNYLELARCVPKTGLQSLEGLSQRGKLTTTSGDFWQRQLRDCGGGSAGMVSELQRKGPYIPHGRDMPLPMLVGAHAALVDDSMVGNTERKKESYQPFFW